MTSLRPSTFLTLAIGLLVLGLLPACANRFVGASQSEISEGVSEAELEEDLLANTTEDTLLISPDSMGPARLGMTLGELRQTGLGIGVLQPWISDFDALPVSDGSEVLFFMVYGSWEIVDDNSPIGHLVTENPRLTTSEGIGPGSTLAQAETAYGQATLGYNIENHSREFVQFENSIWSDYTFEPAVPNAPENYAGLYGESEGDTYFETRKYRDDAVIDSIAIDLRG